ncbi:quinone-dependent dihydroorotate dehydrogenase [Tistrella bauzanensis]|uniref:quinone-dependent dihydroorotate dehydrogenase n=1 Tax=Tistrella bauzanensis TaxID=657419 RepID=UPI00166D092A|nr:quinone-dependent dihydroorotate dehydrogenase [Tistrella bauzanensis]
MTGGRSRDRWPALRPLVFRLEAERAHALSLWALRTRMAMLVMPPRPVQPLPGLARRLWGLDFVHPLGLAAGYDKNAVAIDPLFDYGFAFVEIGGVTPRPQPGNDRPRLFRLAPDRAVINRMGFNNDGLDMVAARLAARRRRLAGAPVGRRRPVFANLGKNKTSEDALADYTAGLARLGPLVDVVVVNVSSPNTPGLRDLQGRAQLTGLLSGLKAARDGGIAGEARPPILVKIAPDLDDAGLSDVVDAARDAAIDGMVVANTTLARPDSLQGRNRAQAGGLSGRPLKGRALALTREVYRATGGAMPIVGVGGIESARDAWDRMAAGAGLLQLYSALVYEGPGLVARIVDGLNGRMIAEGVQDVGEIVGSAA